MKSKILLGLGVLIFAGASYAAATGAFFTSTAIAQANVFTAGSLNLAIAKNSSTNQPTNGWEHSQTAAWNFSKMAPGGTPSVASVWFKNTGTVNGSHFGISAVNTSTVSHFDKQIRITSLTLAGVNLLNGGAGATIGAYVAPTNCTVTVSGSTTLTSAIASASSGAIICATGSNYNSAWEPAPTIPVATPNVTIESMGGPSVTASEPFDVIASNVTIRGFKISAPSGNYGILVSSGAEGMTAKDNIVTNIGTTLASGNVAGVDIEPGTSGTFTGYTVTDNTITNIGNLTNGSSKGIYIGNTTDAGTVSNVTIQNNIISDVHASVTSHGAYGILLAYGTPGAGSVTNLVIKNNTISNLNGSWAHAIGLEAPTPSAVVALNNIYNLTDHKTPSDAVGVEIEAQSASTISVNENNFAPDVALGIKNETPHAVNGTNNWWGTFTATNHVSGSVNSGNPAGGPFVGFVNGVDQNGNGYADLQDLALTPLVNAPVGLAAGAQKRLVMGVQVDGPTTGDGFQGASLSTNLTFTLSQQ